MGATLSKLWGSFKAAFLGGGGRSHNNTANGQPKDTENGLPTSNTPAKPPTPLPDMGGVKKYEITEVCWSVGFPRVRSWWWGSFLPR